MKSALIRLIWRNVFIIAIKCKFCVSDLESLGFKINETGYEQDPEGLKSLIGVEPPRDQSHPHSILGCLQYYYRFIPNFTTRAQTLLSSQPSDAWSWTDECSLIKDINDRPTLTPFAPNKATTRFTDVSEVGIGGMLEEKGSPALGISRLLNATQNETLVLVQTLRSLHKFYGLAKFQY